MLSVASLKLDQTSTPHFRIGLWKKEICTGPWPAKSYPISHEPRGRGLPTSGFFSHQTNQKIPCSVRKKGSNMDRIKNLCAMIFQDTAPGLSGFEVIRSTFFFPFILFLCRKQGSSRKHDPFVNHRKYHQRSRRVE